jgi:hypothetical protein
VIPSGIRIFVCVEPVDMRLGFDRLAQVARERSRSAHRRTTYSRAGRIDGCV